MNPMKADVEFKKKIIELNETYTLGLSAKELVNTAYFKKLKELYEQEIESFYEIKKLTPYSELDKTHSYVSKNGTKVIPGDEYLQTRVELEIAIQQKQDFLQMIQNDIAQGEEAGKDLVEYKKKLGK